MPLVIAVSVLALVLGACSSSGAGSSEGTVAGQAAPNATTVAACGAPPRPSTRTDAAGATLVATQAFLGTLDDSQRATVSGERTPENLAQWSDLPDELFERAGLRLDAMNPDQQAAAYRILETALSPEGYQQVRQISTADGVLATTGETNLGSGVDHYWMRILGTPAESGAWTVQYGGHHLAVNLTIDGEALNFAPTLWGAQPSSYTAAGASAEPLCGETTRAFALMNALDADQQQQATLDTPVTEIVLGTGQDGRMLAPEGVSAASFTPDQRRLLVELVDEWLRPLNGEQAGPKLAAVQQYLADTTFAWSGATTIGQPIYYRVQGPTFIIEFAHQQGGGPGAGGITHIHSIYREPGNDYGAQLGS